MTQGGGKNPKNQEKSISCLYKFPNITINFIKEIIEELKRKPSDRCTEKNAGSSVTLVNEKLKFARYNRSGGVGTRAARFIRKLLSSVPKLGSRAQNDPGAEILCNISAFIKKIIVASKRIRSDSCTEKMSDATLRCQPAGASCRGSILIEFAICMPVLIILLFYINDLVKIKRYYSQTEFVGQQMANILQNISKNQPVTLTNIKHACALAWLSAYHRTAEPIPYTNIYYISTKIAVASVPTFESCGCEGEGVNLQYIYQCGGPRANAFAYAYYSTPEWNSTVEEECPRERELMEEFFPYDPSRWPDCDNCVLTRVRCYPGSSGSFSAANFYCDDVASYQTQQTDPGKAACAWGIGLYGNPNGLWTKDGDTISADKTSSTVRWGQNVDPSDIYPTLKISDSQEKIIIETQFRTNSESPRTAFGLHLVNPPSKVPDGSRYFSSVVIFQPKSGLFNTNAPQ